MRVLITGGTGFVGRWLTSELREAGHEPIPIGDQVDVRSFDDVQAAIAHAKRTEEAERSQHQRPTHLP